VRGGERARRIAAWRAARALRRRDAPTVLFERAAPTLSGGSPAPVSPGRARGFWIGRGVTMEVDDRRAAPAVVARGYGNRRASGLPTHLNNRRLGLY